MHSFVTRLSLPSCRDVRGRSCAQGAARARRQISCRAAMTDKQASCVVMARRPATVTQAGLARAIRAAKQAAAPKTANLFGR